MRNIPQTSASAIPTALILVQVILEMFPVAGVFRLAVLLRLLSARLSKFVPFIGCALPAAFVRLICGGLVNIAAVVVVGSASIWPLLVLLNVLQQEIVFRRLKSPRLRIFREKV